MIFHRFAAHKGTRLLKAKALLNLADIESESLPTFFPVEELHDRNLLHLDWDSTKDCAKNAAFPHRGEAERRL